MAWREKLKVKITQIYKLITPIGQYKYQMHKLPIDISRLVYAYTTNPEYKLLEPINRMLISKHANWKTIMGNIPSFYANPRAMRYIKKYPVFNNDALELIMRTGGFDKSLVNYLSPGFEFLQKNPNPELTEHILKVISKITKINKSHNVLIQISNPNIEYLDKIFSIYLDKKQPISYSRLEELPDKVSDNLLERILQGPDCETKYNILCRNPSDKAVNYVMDNWDLIHELKNSDSDYYRLDRLYRTTTNTNPRIIDKFRQELGKYVKSVSGFPINPTRPQHVSSENEGLIISIIWGLSRNHSTYALEIVKKYWDISYVGLCTNPNPIAVKMFKSQILNITNYDITLNRFETMTLSGNIILDTKNRFVQTYHVLESNTNDKLVKWIISQIDKTEGLEYGAIKNFSNPAFFEVDKERTRRKFNLVIKYLEHPKKNRCVLL